MCDVKGLVSITIPFYNSERFLSETIESVLDQTYTDWELFLVDDGSTDRSSEIAREYAARVPAKIRYLEHEGHRNCGVTRTRNLGAENSQGEYLAFLDSDDVWLPTKLQHQVGLMEASPRVGLVCGPSEYWYDWDESAGEENHTPPLATAGEVYLPPALLMSSHPLGSYGAPCPSSLLIRQSVFKAIGGFVEDFNPQTFQLYEDTAFLTKVYLHAPVLISDCCTDRYRCHPQSIWQRTKGTGREELERRFYFLWLRQYLRDQAIDDPEIWKAVRKTAWMYWLPLPGSVTRLIRRVQHRLSP